MNFKHLLIAFLFLFVTAPALAQGTNSNRTTLSAEVNSCLIPNTLGLISESCVALYENNFLASFGTQLDSNTWTGVNIFTNSGSAWQGGAIQVPYGGTGGTAWALGGPLLGNGSAALTQGTRSGTTTVFATINGALTNGDCISSDSNHNLVDSGGACGGGGGGGGTVNPGTAGQVGTYLTTSSSISGANITSFLSAGSGVTVSGTTTATLATTFAQPDTNSTTRTALAHSQDFISVLDFLPTNAISGTTDYSTYFQYAATAGCAGSRNNQGMKIFVPAPPFGGAGVYYVHDITQSCANYWQGAGRGVTQINYSGATSFFMQWQISGYPSFLVFGNIEGGGISDMSLLDSASGTRVAIEVFGFQDWIGERLFINNSYNAFEFAGDEFPTLSDVTGYNGRNQDVQNIGDLSGCANSVGPGCTVCHPSSATCSTRSDSLHLRNVNFIDNTSTSTCVWYQGFVSDLNMMHVACEGPAYGIHVSCQGSLNANMGQCPQHIFAYDFETENADVNPLYMVDFVQARFEHSYFFGDATSNNTYDLDIGCVTYCASSVPCCRFTVDTSLIFAAYNDNIIFSGSAPLWDIQITNSEINGANVGNGGGQPINFNGVSVTHFKINSNTFCNVDNYAGGNASSRAINLSAGSQFGVISDNIFDGCNSSNSPININGNSHLGTIHIDGNVGPGGSPTISSCGGGSPHINNGNGDRSFAVSVGSGSPGSCTVNFGTIWPTAPECNAQAVPGSASPGSVGTSTTQVTINQPTNNGAYFVQCTLN